MRVSLSTMWAQQTRFDGHMDEFARIAADSGYTAIEPSHSTNTEGLEQLIDKAVLPLASLHAPTPRRREYLGRWNADLNLAAIDEDEREAALTATYRTIDYARSCGAAAVVVHLGGCGDRMLSAERQLRAMALDDPSFAARIAALRVEAESERAALAQQHLPQAARSLEALAEYAANAGIAIGLENRLHYHEIPRYDEVAELIATYPSNLVGYWHDIGHAEVQHRLGLVDRHCWLDTNGPRTIGSHLHDVSRIVDHRAPGEGDVDWQYIVDGLPSEALRTFEINQHEPQSLLAPALELLRRVGLVPPDA
jgi:sugar phosphate isomerase/epimerase